MKLGTMDEEKRGTQMIKSMTGFGRCEVTEDTRKYTVEIKSVNHRYFDVNIRMPKKLNFFDSAIRGVLKEYAVRGKIDVFITYEDTSENQVSLKYNEALAKEYLEYFQKMSDTFGVDNDIRVSMLSRCPEVLSMEEQREDEEALWVGLEKACRGAFEKFRNTRITEGESLKQNIESKLELLSGYVENIEKRNPQILKEYRAKLQDKVNELLADTMIDEGRLATELVLYSDKICNDEETVRLKSHIQQMRKTLGLTEGIGRKLDFIAQELNREANTILSKANDIETSNYAIDLKTEIEKIREQIQNLE